MTSLLQGNCTHVHFTRQGCMQKFSQGGANLGYGQKRGGGSFCEVLHATLARGGMTQGGANAPPSPPPPLNTALQGNNK